MAPRTAMPDRLHGRRFPRHLLPEAGQLHVSRDAGRQFADTEWLGQVIIRPALEDLGSVSFPVPGREEDRWDRAGRGMGEDRPQQPEAVEERHRHAGEHQIRGMVRIEATPGLTIADDLDVATSMKKALEFITHVGTIDGREDFSSFHRILNVSVPRGSPLR